MAKRMFTVDELRRILWEEEGEIILNKITGTGRWDTHHRLVFSPEGCNTLYETTYTRGATENQHHEPWEYDDEIECVEVEAFDKTVVDYRAVSE